MQKTFHTFFKLIDFKREYQQKSSGLNYLQLHSLEKIYKEKAMKTLEISKTLQISPSTLIGVLDELERQKLILRERQERDKRVVLVTVTNKGEEVVKKHFEEDEKFLTNLLKELDEDEQKHLIMLLDKITGNISELEELFK
ncbi:MAG: transcriptional regulator, MarR family [Clostridia bacterium]|jgi:DNA-binding MarR family transcriptional regulator|nr:transcriptional regulator, MarR family [Clostridia bacterium]